VRGLLVIALAVIAAATLRTPPPAPPPVLRESRPTAVPPPDAPDSSLRGRAPHDSIEALRARIAAVLAREQVPGCAIALVDRDGPIWIGGIGVADVESNTPMAADTVFRVGSLTKSFLVLGVMRLVEQGKLDLDAPVRGVELDSAFAAPVTLAQLLEHTSGLDDMRPNEFFSDDEDLSAAAALAINPRSRVVRWSPGSRLRYSNVAYTVAGRLIELATGEPFDAYLRREVLRPMGIGDADFRRTPALAARLATGYVAPGRRAKFTPLAHRPAGALLASAADLAKLVQLYLRRGDGLVSPASMTRIERNGTLPYPPTAVSYGLANYGDVSFPIYARGHNGGMPGFSADLRYFPDAGRGYVILLNSTYDGSWLVQAEIRSAVFAYLMRDKARPAPLARVPASEASNSVQASAPRADQLARRARPGSPAEPPGADYFARGVARSDLFGIVDDAMTGWDVTVDGDAVHLDALRGESDDLVPAGDGGYRHADECGSSVRFATSPDGTPVMLYYNLYTEPASSWLGHLRYRGLGIAMVLLHYAPLWAVIAIAYAWWRRRRAAVDVLACNALAGLCCGAVPRLFYEAAMRDVVGVCHPLTIALCGVTIAFAVSAAAALACAVRWMMHPSPPPRLGRIVPTITALAAVALAIWLGAHGLIGVRTWAF
jgi:CubicO group peptidase (beta-lactamase class C family)